MTMRYGKSLYQSNDTYLVHDYKNREEWLKGRVKGIGGSDSAAAIGKNPWRSNVDLWMIKTGRKKQPDISDAIQVKYGIEAEDYLRRLYQLDNSDRYEVQYAPNIVLQSANYPYMLYSPDGLLVEKDSGRKGILEIKTTTIMKSWDKEKWKEQIPENYFIQVLHGLIVTGFDFIELSAQLKYDQNYSQRKTYHIEKNEVIESMNFLKEELSIFWNEYVLADKEPGLILPEL